MAGPGTGILAMLAKPSKRGGASKSDPPPSSKGHVATSLRDMFDALKEGRDDDAETAFRAAKAGCDDDDPTYDADEDKGDDSDTLDDM